MKLYQAKNYIAIKHFYKKWKWITPDEREEIFDEVAELYAEQKVKNLAQPDVSGSFIAENQIAVDYVNVMNAAFPTITIK